MSKKTLYTSSLVAVLVLAMAAWSYAGPGWGQGNGYGMMGGNGYGYRMMDDDSDNGPGNCPGYGQGYGQGYGRGNSPFAQLTQEKQDAARKVFETYGEKFSTLRDKLMVKRLTLESLVNSGTADEGKIEKLVGDMSKLRDQLRDTRSQMDVDLEKATGISRDQFRGQGRAFGPCGSGFGPGHGNGMGYGMGYGPRS